MQVNEEEPSPAAAAVSGNEPIPSVNLTRWKELCDLWEDLKSKKELYMQLKLRRDNTGVSGKFELFALVFSCTHGLRVTIVCRLGCVGICDMR